VRKPPCSEISSPGISCGSSSATGPGAGAATQHVLSPKVSELEARQIKFLPDVVSAS